MKEHVLFREMASRRWRASLQLLLLFSDSASAARSSSSQKATLAYQSLYSVVPVSIAAPGPNERIGNDRFRGTGCEVNVGSAGVVGLRGGRPACPQPVMVSVGSRCVLGKERVVSEVFQPEACHSTGRRTLCFVGTSYMYRHFCCGVSSGLFWNSRH